MSILVIGAGMVGGYIARFLSQDLGHRVGVADADPRALDRLPQTPGLEKHVLDLAHEKKALSLAREHDILVCALPGRFSPMVKALALEAGRHLVDITSGGENPLDLHEAAREKNLILAVDMGVAPGISNMLAGMGYGIMDTCQSIRILVGGLPQHPVPPWNYKVSWSLADTFAEYTIPARFRENGEVKTRPALSEIEKVVLPHVGEVEAFLTNGLFTLVHTLDVPDMKEKTVRYPGYADKMKIFIQSGFLDETPVMVRGRAVKPADVAAALLGRAWRLEPGEGDLVVMRVEVKGKNQGKRADRVFDLLVASEDGEAGRPGVTAMARATGIPCAAAAHMISQGVIASPGVWAGEHLGLDETACKYMMDLLAAHKMEVVVHGDEYWINDAAKEALDGRV